MAIHRGTKSQTQDNDVALFPNTDDHYQIQTDTTNAMQAMTQHDQHFLGMANRGL